MRNRQVEMQSIIKLVGRYTYSESQGFMLLMKECQKIGDILMKCERKLINDSTAEAKPIR